MALKYNVIEIFTSEEAKYGGQSLYSAVVQYISRLKIAARCVVSRGIAGCYENGEMATQHILVLSYNMPVKIEIILPSPELESVLPKIEEMVSDGIVVVEEMEIRTHKTQKRLIPRQIKVRDVMTSCPKFVKSSAVISDVIKLLLSSDFNGVPVVDDGGKPIGIITQGDLLTRAGMPVRIGLLKEFELAKIDPLVESLKHKTCQEIMTHPAVTIQEDRPLVEAVNLMIKKGLKRLPVTDVQGKLTGIVARVDVFRTITKESPDWKTLQKEYVNITNFKQVRDIMRRDTHTVLPDTPISEIVKVIDDNDIQRVAVVDNTGRFMGLISDKDLLAAFSSHRAGMWDYLVGKLSFTETGRRHKELYEQLKAKTASDIMKRNPITAREDSSIDEAVRIMTEHRIKRLPIVDSDGIFKGMVSRDSLLRTDTSQV